MAEQDPVIIYVDAMLDLLYYGVSVLEEAEKKLCVLEGPQAINLLGEACSTKMMYLDLLQKYKENRVAAKR